MKKLRTVFCWLMVIMVAACALTGCDIDVPGYEENDTLTYDEAISELSSKLKKVKVSNVEAPLDIYDTNTETKTLASIDTFPITVQGNGSIDIEIAGATELTADTPDDLLNVWAKQFNNGNFTYNDRPVSVSIRKITSGEIVTYMTEGDYQPDMIIPSSYAWGEMLKSKGIGIHKLTDRLAGNTAGILMENSTYKDFVEKYKSVTVDKVLEASLAGDLTFAYTNPYTSSTGLNILTAMLYSFDNVNPLSDQAAEKLLDYQKQSPPVAYTTAVLREQAAKGIIKAMVMEEQAYNNTPELKDYVYTPAGIRHDHPAYTFDYVSEEKQAVAKMFVEFCLEQSQQNTATEKGFNLHDDYVEQSTGLDGAGYLAAQKIWKANKDGGKPIIAVFVADISGSMDGEPLTALKESLIATSTYISSDNYIGLISYSDSVYVNLPIAQFDETQRAYFSGAVKSLTANGGTATYNAVLQALEMLHQATEEVPDAKLMLFVLSDGEQNRGYSLNKITDIVGGMKIPVYTIGYNLSNSDELRALSQVNEAALIDAKTDDIVNQLRNLFNVQL